MLTTCAQCSHQKFALAKQDSYQRLKIKIALYKNQARGQKFGYSALPKRV